MKEQVNVLENKLVEVFKGAPKIPENGRKSIVNAMPWIALVFGVIQLWVGFDAWRVAHRLNEAVSGLNELSRAFGGKTTAHELGLFFWIMVASTAVSGVLLLLAYPGLKEKKKVGWNWLFYGTLFDLVVGVSGVLVDDYYGGGVGNLVQALISTAIGLWILFQIRDSYLGSKSAPTETK